MKTFVSGTLQVEPELMERFRAASQAAGVSMRAAARQAVLEWTERVERQEDEKKMGAGTQKGT